jgi:hypothetical protein
MILIDDILKYNSVSIVGMAKNTGKTTCLNYVIRYLKEMQVNLAITSIGVDGEEHDVLYQTPKPRIVLHKNMIFVTAEEDFANREFNADVLIASERSTPLGRLVTARAQGTGKVVLSGPSDSKWLYDVINNMAEYDVTLTLVDGALSRMSLASPAVTEAMILCTGAACSIRLPELIKKTKFRCGLIDLEQIKGSLQEKLFAVETAIWKVDEERGEIKKIADSVFTFSDEEMKMLESSLTIYVSGAVTDNFLKMLSLKKNKGIKLIIRDFTKLFIEPGTYEKFIRRGGSIQVLQKAKLLAVCTNPTSPQGFNLDPVRLKNDMQEALQIPVYDIMMEEKVNGDYAKK